jgi:O-succinylbenzoic acid--CoA ligase
LPWREERLASMTLTSGSTGLPKAAVHSCRAHLASAEGVLAMIPLASDDDWLLSLPLFHVSGQGILWRWLLAGAPDGRRKTTAGTGAARLYACLAGAHSALALAQ